MSAKTGVAPRRKIEPTDAKNENGVVTTSSPGPTPQAISAASSPSVPDETPTACGIDSAAQTSRSKASVSAPAMNRPEVSTRTAAAASSGSSGS